MEASVGNVSALPPQAPKMGNVHVQLKFLVVLVTPDTRFTWSLLEKHKYYASRVIPC